MPLSLSLSPWWNIVDPTGNSSVCVNFAPIAYFPWLVPLLCDRLEQNSKILTLKQLWNLPLAPDIQECWVLFVISQFLATVLSAINQLGFVRSHRYLHIGVLVVGTFQTDCVTDIATFLVYGSLPQIFHR